MRCIDFGSSYPGSQNLLQLPHLRARLLQMRTEALRLPDLELVTETHERHAVRDPGMSFHRLGQDHPPFRVDLQDLARAEQGRRELIPLVRIGRQGRQRTRRSRSGARCPPHPAPARRVPDERRAPRTRRAPEPHGTTPGSRPALSQSSRLVKLDTKRSMGRCSHAPDISPGDGSRRSTASLRGMHRLRVRCRLAAREPRPPPREASLTG